MEVALAEYENTPAPQPKTFLCPLDLLKDVIDYHGCCEADSAIEEALRNSSVYQQWQKSMPWLKDVQHIHQYQAREKSDIDLYQVCDEIKTHGAFLAKDQILFRGGSFNGMTEIEISCEPTSTSLSPSVAHWHAQKSSKEIAILRIADNEDVQAFVYRTKGNRGFNQEFEVLLQNNICLKMIAKFQHLNFCVIEYDVFSNR